jgi:hypothetical protein
MEIGKVQVEEKEEQAKTKIEEESCCEKPPEVRFEATQTCKSIPGQSGVAACLAHGDLLDSLGHQFSSRISWRSFS